MSLYLENMPEMSHFYKLTASISWPYHEKKSVLNIYIIIQTLYWFTIGLMLPILSLMILKKGHEISDVGLCMGVYAGMALLLELPTGGLADSIGRKKVNLFSLIVLLCSFIMLTFSESISSFYISFGILGASRALSSGTLDAWFVDSFGTGNSKALQDAFAKIGIFITMGLGIGSFIGGSIPTWIGDLSHLYLTFNMYSGTLIMAACCTVMNIALTFILVDEQFESKYDGFIASIKAVPEIITSAFTYGIKHHTTFMLIIASVLFGFTSNSIEYLWQPKVEAISGGAFKSWHLGLIGAGYFVFGAIGSYLSSPISHYFNWSLEKSAFLMRLISGICIVGFATATNIFIFTFLYWVYFLTNCINSPYHSTLFNENIPSDKRSSLLSLLSFQSFSVKLGGVIGAIGLGYVSEMYSLELAISIGGIIVMGSSFLYLNIKKDQTKVVQEGKLS